VTLPFGGWMDARLEAEHLEGKEADARAAAMGSEPDEPPQSSAASCKREEKP
jgi:hypothetical protein